MTLKSLDLLNGLRGKFKCNIQNIKTKVDTDSDKGSLVWLWQLEKCSKNSKNDMSVASC